jgi:hypothetical protein
MRSLLVRIHPSATPLAAGAQSPIRCPVELLEWSGPDSAPVVLVGAETLEFDLAPASPLGRLNAPLADGTPERDLRSAGATLLGSLASGARVAHLSAFASAAPRLPGAPAPPPLRLVLDIHEPRLRGLPWESMNAGHAGNAGGPFLALHDGRPIVRAQLPPTPAALHPTPRPLTMLLAVLCDPNDGQVAWRPEVERIEDIVARSAPFLRLIQLGVRSRTSAAELADAIEKNQPHILHLIGHGIPATPGTDSMLRVVTSTGEEMIAAGGFRTMLAASVPHLAFINACHGAAAAHQELWTLTQPFLDAGTPAVIGMNGAISGDAAAALSASLYASLLGDGSPVDVALSKARRECLGGQPMSPHALMPTLVVQTHPDCVLRARCTPELHGRVRQIPHLACGERFVGRWAERLHAMGEALAVPQSSRVHVVHGVASIGKTDFTRVLLRYLATEGWHVGYLSLAGRRAMEVSDLLRTAREAFALTVHTAQEVQDAFSAFDRTLAAFDAARRGAEVIAAGMAVQVDPIRALFDAFLASLAALSERQPAILALDATIVAGEGLLGDAWQQYLLPMLIAPAAGGGMGKARLLIAARTADLPHLGLRPLPNGVTESVITHFRAEDSEIEVAQWLLQVLGRDRRTRYSQLHLADCFSVPWSPDDLQKVASALGILRRPVHE